MVEDLYRNRTLLRAQTTDRDGREARQDVEVPDWFLERLVIDRLPEDPFIARMGIGLTAEVYAEYERAVTAVYRSAAEELAHNAFDEMRRHVQTDAPVRTIG